MSEKKELIARVWFTESRSCGLYAHIHCDLVTIENEQIVGLYHHPVLGDLDDLTVSCQLDPSTTEPYAWRVRYERVNVDLYTGEKCIKVLRRINAGLERLTQKFGEPLSFGQYLLRVWEILGVDQVRIAALENTRDETVTTRKSAASQVDYHVRNKLADWASVVWAWSE